MHNGIVQYVSLANVAMRIVGQSDRRKRLTLYAPAAGTVTISGQPFLTAGQGITLSAGMAPLYLDVDFHGNCVEQEWYGIKGDSTTTTMGFIETLCNEGHDHAHDTATQRKWPSQQY